MLNETAIRHSVGGRIFFKDVLIVRIGHARAGDHLWYTEA